MILNKYKNQLMDAIVAAKLVPGDFTRTETPSSFKLAYKSGVWFQITEDPNNPDRFSSHFSLFHSGQQQGLPGYQDFTQILFHFKNWLKGQVQRSIDEALVPDLWSQLKQTDRLANTEGETFFSIEEKAQLKLSVEEFRLLIFKTFNPSESEIKVVNERLNYLKEAIDRLNRFDWRSVAMSTLISISIALSLDTDKGRLLFGLFQQVFSTVVHLLK